MPALNAGTCYKINNSLKERKGKFPQEVFDREKEAFSNDLETLLCCRILDSKEKEIEAEKQVINLSRHPVVMKQSDRSLIGFHDGKPIDNCPVKKQTEKLFQQMIFGEYEPPLFRGHEMPEHVLMAMRYYGFNIPWIRAAAWLFRELKFTVKGITVHIANVLTEEGDQAYGENEWRMIYPEPDYFRTSIGKITICRNPHTTINFKGMTIKIQLPETVLSSMAGSKISEYFDIPLFGDFTIDKVLDYKKSTVLRISK